MATYGTPLPGHGNVIAGIYCRSPHQARILQKLLEASMKEYAGRPEEGLLAVWHQEVCSILDRARRNNWQGWEDTNPIWSGKHDH